MSQGEGNRHVGWRERSNWRQRKETTDEKVGNKKGVWEKNVQQETEERC